MVYFLGRDVAVTIGAGENVGVTSNLLDFDGTDTDADFCNRNLAGLAVSDLTGVDLSIGVTDEDVTYMGSRTVLKAEIKKETTVSLTRKKSDNVWDIVFNGARWGAFTGAAIVNAAGEPDMTITAPNGTNQNYFGYQLKIQLKSAEEVFTVPHCQITGHSVTLSADGTTEETLEFISQETPTIGAT